MLFLGPSFRLALRRGALVVDPWVLPENSTCVKCDKRECENGGDWLGGDVPGSEESEAEIGVVGLRRRERGRRREREREVRAAIVGRSSTSKKWWNCGKWSFVRSFTHLSQNLSYLLSSNTCANFQYFL